MIIQPLYDFILHYYWSYWFEDFISIHQLSILSYEIEWENDDSIYSGSLWTNLLPRLNEIVMISWYSYEWDDANFIEEWNISILEIEVSPFQSPF